MSPNIDHNCSAFCAESGGRNLMTPSLKFWQGTVPAHHHDWISACCMHVLKIKFPCHIWCDASSNACPNFRKMKSALVFLLLMLLLSPPIRGENDNRNKTENTAKHRNKRKPNSALSACTSAPSLGRQLLWVFQKCLSTMDHQTLRAVSIPFSWHFGSAVTDSHLWCQSRFSELRLRWLNPTGRFPYGASLEWLKLR